MRYECWDSSGTGVCATIEATSHAEAAGNFVTRMKGRIGKSGLIFVVDNASENYQVFYADELQQIMARMPAPPPPSPEPEPAPGEPKPIKSKGGLRLIKG